jgi:hypothetical protein
MAGAVQASDRDESFEIAWYSLPARAEAHVGWEGATTP